MYLASTLRKFGPAQFMRAARYRKNTARDQSALPLLFADPHAPAQVHLSAPQASATRRGHKHRSANLIHDTLFDGRAFRTLTMVDQVNPQSPSIEPALRASRGFRE
jgi:hypothetical protein